MLILHKNGKHSEKLCKLLSKMFVGLFISLLFKVGGKCWQPLKKWGWNLFSGGSHRGRTLEGHRPPVKNIPVKTLRE